MTTKLEKVEKVAVEHEAKIKKKLQGQINDLKNENQILKAAKIKPNAKNEVNEKAKKDYEKEIADLKKRQADEISELKKKTQELTKQNTQLAKNSAKIDELQTQKTVVANQERHIDELKKQKDEEIEELKKKNTILQSQLTSKLLSEKGGDEDYTEESDAELKEAPDSKTKLKLMKKRSSILQTQDKDNEDQQAMFGEIAE